MTSTSSRVAAVVALATVVLGVQASPVVLDIGFDDGKVGTDAATAPVNVAGHIDGFSFTDATAWNRPIFSKTVNGALDSPPETNQSGTANVFISSIKTVDTNGSSTYAPKIEIETLETLGKDMERLTFDSWFGGNGAFRVFAYEKGRDAARQAFELTGSGGQSSWSSQQTVDLTTVPDGTGGFLNNVNRIAFIGLSTNTYFALDNIKISFASPGDVSNNAPEPASLALVVMALAGAGLARRSRRG